MRVYIVRHGQTDWNVENRAQGHVDHALNEQGRDEAERLAEAFENRPFGRILTSDLQRAGSTAAPLATRHGVTCEARDDLRERSWGDWEGRPSPEVGRELRDLGIEGGKHPEEIAPPGGESQADLWTRLDSVVQDIRESEDSVVVIAHGGTCAMLLARMLRGSYLTAKSFRFDNASITTLQRRPDGEFNLIGYNDVTHLAASTPEKVHGQ